MAQSCERDIEGRGKGSNALSVDEKEQSRELKVAVPIELVGLVLTPAAVGFIVIGMLVSQS